VAPINNWLTPMQVLMLTCNMPGCRRIISRGRHLLCDRHPVYLDFTIPYRVAREEREHTDVSSNENPT
jgi:hypothetical protein